MEFASLRRADGLRIGTSLLPCPVSSRPERPPDSPWGPPFSIGQDAHFPGFIAKSNEVASLRFIAQEASNAWSGDPDRKASSVATRALASRRRPAGGHDAELRAGANYSRTLAPAGLGF